jgi:hypothetical protein
VASREPVVGRCYQRIPHAWGNGLVEEVEHGADGRWTRVRVSYPACCFPEAPPRRPDAPESEWKVPTNESWIERGEWERMCPFGKRA